MKPGFLYLLSFPMDQRSYLTYFRRGNIVLIDWVCVCVCVCVLSERVARDWMRLLLVHCVLWVLCMSVKRCELLIERALYQCLFCCFGKRDLSH